MYAQKSVELKSDFYSRYGQTQGKVYFEKTGLPCKILDGGKEFMAFSLGCGVRAYGRKYGDILKVMDSESNICDVHFVKSGGGAQILYKKDIDDISEMKETAIYTVNKLLRSMGCDERLSSNDGLESVCDRYGDEGWCAVKFNGRFFSAPLPLGGYNVIMIRTRKRKIKADNKTMEIFFKTERDRIAMACESLKKCGLDKFFEVINESEVTMERMLNLSDELMSAVESARCCEGVCAVRICDIGVIAFVRRSDTDVAVHRIINECKTRLGYAVRVAVVK